MLNYYIGCTYYLINFIQNCVAHAYSYHSLFLSFQVSQLKLIFTASKVHTHTWLPPHPPKGGKESACNAGDLGLIPRLGRSPEEGKGYPLQYSGLENSMNCIVHGVAKNWTQLNNFHFYSPSEDPTYSISQEANSMILCELINVDHFAILYKILF